MLSMDSLQVAEEEVVESTSNRLEDIYMFLAAGCYPQSMTPLRRKNLKRYSLKFNIEGQQLYYVGPKKDEKREVVIDDQQKRQIFLECHFNDIGHHLGQKKTVHRIQSKYYWLGIVKDVVDWIKICETCQHTERNKNMTRTVRPIKVEGPWEILAIDVLGPFPESIQGNTHVVFIADYMSKWVEVVPLQKRDSLSVARAIASAVHRFGLAKTAFCSQRADFCEEVTKHLYDRWNLTQKVSPVQAPQTNALFDRSSGLLKEALQHVIVEKQAEWDDYLEPVLLTFRTSPHPITRFTPYYLMFNREASLPSEVDSSHFAYNQDRDVDPVKDDLANQMILAMEEQQKTVKQLVVSNMTTAYKQEKKERKAKRRTQNTPSLVFKMQDDPFSSQDSPPLKKLKENLFLSFSGETVLDSEQSSSDDKKSDLEFPLPVSDVP